MDSTKDDTFVPRSDAREPAHGNPFVGTESLDTQPDFTGPALLFAAPFSLTDPAHPPPPDPLRQSPSRSLLPPAPPPVVDSGIKDIHAPEHKPSLPTPSVINPALPRFPPLTPPPPSSAAPTMRHRLPRVPLSGKPQPMPPSAQTTPYSPSPATRVTNWPAAAAETVKLVAVSGRSAVCANDLGRAYARGSGVTSTAVVAEAAVEAATAAGAAGAPTANADPDKNTDTATMLARSSADALTMPSTPTMTTTSPASGIPKNAIDKQANQRKRLKLYSHDQLVQFYLDLSAGSGQNMETVFDKIPPPVVDVKIQDLSALQSEVVSALKENLMSTERRHGQSQSRSQAPSVAHPKQSLDNFNSYATIESKNLVDATLYLDAIHFIVAAYKLTSKLVPQVCMYSEMQKQTNNVLKRLKVLAMRAAKAVNRTPRDAATTAAVAMCQNRRHEEAARECQGVLPNVAAVLRQGVTTVSSLAPGAVENADMSAASNENTNMGSRGKAVVNNDESGENGTEDVGAST